VMCVNEPQREALIQRGIPPEKLITILSVHSLPAVKSSMPANGDRFRMVWHGTVSKRLGIDLIVRAAAKLTERIPGFELHIYGKGDEMDYIVDLAQELGVGGSVQFHGEVPWDTLPKELAGMDAGIVGNRRNIATELMLPVKLIDFVALEVPAIVPRLRTLNYYFSDDTVTFFEPGDVDSMVEATVRLYKDPVSTSSKVAKAKTFLEQYRWEKQPGLRQAYAFDQ
jgi:glycosyltransferase involved in cell wall biosynthesis